MRKITEKYIAQIPQCVGLSSHHSGSWSLRVSITEVRSYTLKESKNVKQRQE